MEQGWAGLVCARRKQSLTGRPGKPKAEGPTPPLTPVEGPRCWAPMAGPQDKQDSPWGRKRRGQKGSQ